jgi:hypothetical protein
VRAGWKGARWLNGNGKPFDMLAALTVAENTGILDCPVWIGRKKTLPLPLRLVAFGLPPIKVEEARARARRAAEREGYAISGSALAAAGWLILVTSLDATAFPAAKIGELYRARWRIEMAFKRLKTIIGLQAPPGEDAAVAKTWIKTWILAHLLMVLLIEPQLSAPEVSPRLAA